MKSILTIAFASLFFFGFAHAGEMKPKAPSKEDKCPVCGMFVAKYPDWIVAILFKDGSYAYFDGVKDMMKYYFNMPKYNPTKTTADIDSIHVTDYYELKLIDGLKAYYVEGSDVYGPMGRELIPMEKEEDAKEFIVDHSGKAILRFNEITVDLIKTLD